jgi:hypothetical protein
MKWHEFHDSFLMYLHGKKGQDIMPLACIIQDQDNPMLYVAYANEHACMVWTLPLIGDAFISDNGTIYDSLKSYLLASPAWPWIQQ